MTVAPALRDAPGRSIIGLSWLGTGVFTISAVTASILPSSLGVPSAVVALVLFSAGVVAFLWAYGIAVNRSRTDAIGIGGLFFLAGTAPAAVRWALMGPLAAQVVVALATASVRIYTALAFGILVPMFGLGLAGLWGARHGRFEARSATTIR